MSSKQPVVFLSHGGGPSFFLSGSDYPPLRSVDKDSNAAKYLRSLVKSENLPHPRAVLVVSAHWEEKHPTVMTGAAPPLYYDYGGFPSAMYKLNWPAKGAPDIALRTKELLEQKGLTCHTNDKRGYDHGVFVPLLLVYPKPDVPVFQLSLLTSLDMACHLDLGEALSDLRDEGVLIIGSGFTTHGREMMDGSGPPAEWLRQFQTWLHDLLSNKTYTREDKRNKLIEGIKDANFRRAHPRAEHFLPIAVTLAAAGYSCPRIAFSDFLSSNGLFENYIYNS